MGSLKLIVGLFAIVAVVYLLAELAPPYMSNYQFEDALKTEAQMSTYNNKSEDAIRDEVYKKGAGSGCSDRQRAHQGTARWSDRKWLGHH